MLCFRKVLAAKKFWIRGKWSYQDFPSKKFSLTVPKNAVGESFSLSLISCIQKNLDERVGGWGSVMIFRRNFYVSHCLKISEGTSSVCH